MICLLCMVVYNGGDDHDHAMVWKGSRVLPPLLVVLELRLME